MQRRYREHNSFAPIAEVAEQLLVAMSNRIRLLAPLHFSKDTPSQKTHPLKTFYAELASGPRSLANLPHSLTRPSTSPDLISCER